MRFLSDEWLTAASSALRDQPGHDGSVIVQYVVPDAADHHLRFEPEGIHLTAGRHAAPTVTFTLDYATAAAINRGELSLQEAVITGRAGVSGDLHALRDSPHPTAGALDALRPATTY